MYRYEARYQILAVGMAALAGFVDSVGFLKLGGLFVSFMSGNSTRLAVAVAGQSPVVITAAGLIISFVGGVVLGSMVGRVAGEWRMPSVLAAVVLLLSFAATSPSMKGATLATLLMACAMGAANGVFHREGEVTIGVTYMTGALIKLGQHLEASFNGGKRYAWSPFLFLWCGLVGGAIAGAAAYAVLDLRALWIAVGYGALLTLGATSLGPERVHLRMPQPPSMGHAGLTPRSDEMAAASAGQWAKCCPDAKAILLTSLSYFIVVFTVAFATGVMRVLFVAPSIGAPVAIVIEVPLLLILSWLVARRVFGDRNFTVPGRLVISLMVFTYTMTAEILLSKVVWGRGVAQWTEAVTTPLGLAGLAGQVGFASFPFLVGFRRRRFSAGVQRLPT